MTEGEQQTTNIKRMVEECVTKLAEHCDSVQIMVTLHDSEGQKSRSFENGAGNFYARYGQCVEWCAMQDQYQREEAKRRDKEDHL